MGRARAMKDLVPINDGGDFLLYTSEDGESRIEVRMVGETIWLTQNQMAELFQTSKQNVSQHLKAIYDSGELQPGTTVKKFLTVRPEGNRQVAYLNSRNFLKEVYSLSMACMAHTSVLI